MKNEVNHPGGGKRALTALLFLLCALAVMTAAVLVRTTPERFRGDAEKTREAYTSESGVPYLTDMDSYYHVRLVKNYLDHGSQGDSIAENGTAWDSLRFFPEGRSAEYQPAIVRLTAGLWKLVGGNLDALEYRLAAFMSAFAALAAFLIGWRIGGVTAGLTAGLLVGCAPFFALRTAYGRFDTDMFVVLMELLLILFLTESLRARKRVGRIGFAAAFALTATLYALCWQPTYSMLFVWMTAAGGLLYCVGMAVAAKVKGKKLNTAEGKKGAALASEGTAKKKGTASTTESAPKKKGTASSALNALNQEDPGHPDGGFFRMPETRTLLLLAVLAAAGLLVTAGTKSFASMFSVLFPRSSAKTEGVLPNLFQSISELNRVKFLPGGFLQSFSGYVKGEQTIVNGVGGLLAAAVGTAGLYRLGRLSFQPEPKKGEKPLPAKLSALYFCVLGVWFVGGLYLALRGIRYVMHFSIPLGLLAGAATGLVGKSAGGTVRQDAPRKDKVLLLLRKRGLPVLLCVCTVLPAVLGAARACADARPSVTDASSNAMRWLRENAAEDAVAASWWDMGYYYENEAMHPTFWDGGSQDSVRSILVSRALTSRSAELSRRILLMLSGSGNSAVNLLMQYTDYKTTFEVLWQALVADRAEATELLQTRCGMSAEEAEEAEKLIHPEETPEVYLVITYTMTRQIGWYEYYANWDFTGKQSPPAATLYSYTPEGTPIFDTEAGQAYLENARGKETMWRLFFGAEKTSRFTPVYESHDGLEHVRIWRVETER